MATTTPLQGLPIPETTDDPDVVGDITSLALAIEKRLAGVYTTVADRDSKITAPQAGQIAVLTGSNVVTAYLGGTWKQVYPAAGPAITSGTGAPAGGANGDVYFRV